MPKLDLSRALRIKGAAGEIAQLKGPGFAWQTRLAWTPARLFEKAEVGAWFDPTDISTLFQDASGTPAVSAAGQSVGRALDASGRGLHATAAGTKRPTYGVVPKGGRRNELTNTGLQGAVVGTPGTAPTGWQIGFATGSISAVAADAALGGNSVTVSATGARQFLQQNFNAAANTIWTLSADVVLSQTTQMDTCIVFASTPVGATQTFFLNGAQVSNLTQIPAGAHKVAVRLVVGATAGTGIQARVGIGCSGLATGSVKVMNPQREAGAIATAYQLAVSQFDVREAGVQSLAYLYDDLVDDALTWVAPTGVYTIAYVDTSAAVTILSGQALSGATDVLLPRQLGGYVAVNRALTALEVGALTAYLAAKMGG